MGDAHIMNIRNITKGKYKILLVHCNYFNHRIKCNYAQLTLSEKIVKR